MILITIKNSKTFGLMKEIIIEEDKQNDVACLKQKNKDKKTKRLNEKRYHSNKQYKLNQTLSFCI